MNRPVSRGPDGYTLIEFLITISILAILSALAISYFGSLLPAARQATAGSSAELLNDAVKHYGQVNSEIAIAATDGSSDEVAVVALLKVRSAASPGSPYIPAEVSITPSSVQSDVRLYWTGKYFKIIPEGTAGTGIEVNH